MPTPKVAAALEGLKKATIPYPNQYPSRLPDPKSKQAWAGERLDL